MLIIHRHKSQLLSVDFKNIVIYAADRYHNLMVVDNLDNFKIDDYNSYYEYWTIKGSYNKCILNERFIWNTWYMILQMVSYHYKLDSMF